MLQDCVKQERERHERRVRQRGERHVIHQTCHNVESCTQTWQGLLSDVLSSYEEKKKKKEIDDYLLTVAGSLSLSGPITQEEEKQHSSSSTAGINDLTDSVRGA